MQQEFKKKRTPYGLPFLNIKETKLLQEKTRHSQEILIKYGFERVMPSALDYPETFDRYHSKDSFRLRDSLGEDLSLRNDVTVQVIKGFTNIFELSEEAWQKSKFFYNASVFRDIKRSYPALREVYQMGAESIGISENESIPQLIEIGHEILHNAFHLEHHILVGDIRVFQKLQESCTADIKEISIQKDTNSLAKQFVASGWSAGLAGELSKNLLYYQDETEFFDKWNLLKTKLTVQNQKNILESFESHFHNLSKLLLPLQKIKIPVSWEPLLVRDVSYYTGLLFEGYVPNLISAPLRGGAYDRLISEYSDKDLPASGFALDISSLI